MAIDDDVRLEVRSDPCLLSVVRGLVHEWLAVVALPEDRREEVVLAIDEACSNAIRHSYGGRCDEVVEVRLRTDADRLQLEVLDSGKPCPKHLLREKPSEPPDAAQLEPGGLGVQLMYRVFDEVVFENRAGGGNRVTMRVKRTERG